jgi:(p)ppGpp synthase/HD superfamily hydrolase
VDKEMIQWKLSKGITNARQTRNDKRAQEEREEEDGGKKIKLNKTRKVRMFQECHNIEEQQIIGVIEKMQKEQVHEK